jgi:hypothetical protein
VTGADLDTGAAAERPAAAASASAAAAAERDRLRAIDDRPRGNVRRAAVVAAALVAVVLLAVLLGLPGPEPVRRYSAGSLQGLVDTTNERSREPRPNDPCRGDPVTDPASIDWWRGRVVIADSSFDASSLTEDERAMVSSTIYAQVSCELGP